MISFLRLAVAFTLDEIRAIGHADRRRVEVLHLWTRARYVFDPAATDADDGDNFLAPTETCRCCDGTGRWVKWAPSGSGSGVTAHGDLTGLDADDHPQYVTVDGSSPFTGDQSMGMNKLTELGAPEDPDDAARLQDIDDQRVQYSDFLINSD